NYFNQLENSHDPVHLSFAHLRSRFTEGGLVGVPRVWGEETDWGVAVHAQRPDGKVRTNQFCMPNAVRRTSPPEDPAETRWQEAFAWRVPIDDTSYRSFLLDLIHLTGDAAERYRRERREREARVAEAGEVNDVAARILRGELRVQDIVDHPNIVNIQ